MIFLPCLFFGTVYCQEYIRGFRIYSPLTQQQHSQHAPLRLDSLEDG
jgi:hypothetical protein